MPPRLIFLPLLLFVASAWAHNTPAPKAHPSPTKAAAAQPSPSKAAQAPKPSATARPAAQVSRPSAAAQTPTPSAAPDLCYQQLQRFVGINRNNCAQAQLKPSGAFSVEKRPILIRDMPAAPSINKPSRILVLGAIHGDEPSSAVLSINWIELAKEIPANSHWRFIPALNPDGLLAKRPRRTNANGVDLNRNFPTPNWENEANEYWGKRTKRDPRRWPGDKPLSEPETRLVHEQMESFAPQLIVSIHAPYGVLDFDGPTIPPDKLGRLYLDQIGIFPGSLGNYGGVYRGIPVVTIELPDATKGPNPAETRQMWLDLLRWMSARGY